jgi:hypothetical protein
MCSLHKRLKDLNRTCIESNQEKEKDPDLHPDGKRVGKPCLALRCRLLLQG